MLFESDFIRSNIADVAKHMWEKKLKDGVQVKK